MSVYFNENDKFAAQWLRNLYPEATIDERSIKEVEATDVAGHERCHFFGGIGGWEYALGLAGWSGPVWTGSCPCQPFSQAGAQKGEADERHLWPEFRRLIAECLPATILGEQVASRLGREWLARVRADLEALGYAVGAADLCAASVGAPHIRQRLWWVANSQRAAIQRRGGCIEPLQATSQAENETQQWQWCRSDAGHCEPVGGVVNAPAMRWPRGNGAEQQAGCGPRAGCLVGTLANTECDGGRIDEPEQGSEGRTFNQWSDSTSRVCADGTARRVGSRVQPLAYGIPRDLGRRIPELRSVAASARTNRVGRLRGYGNAIVPQVAAVFIRAFMEASY